MADSKNVYQRLAEAQAHIVAPRQASRFRGGSRSAEQILEAAKPACREAGLLLHADEQVEFIGERSRIKVTVRVVNIDKPEEFISASSSAWEGDVSAGLDQSQVSGKTGSYAKKYALQNLFSIDDTKDADFEHEADTPKPAPVPKQVATEVLETMASDDDGAAPTQAQLDRIREIRAKLGYPEAQTETKIKLLKTKAMAGAAVGKLKAELDQKQGGE